MSVADDFALLASGYQPVEGVSYGHYLNDCEADGYFGLER